MKVHTMFAIAKRNMIGNAVSARIHGKGNLGANRVAKQLPIFCCR